MMTNITILTHGRPRLTEQALRTIKENTPIFEYTLTTFDDESKAGTGGARNIVIKQSQDYHGRGDYLYLSDNDVAFTPRWLPTLIAAYEFASSELMVAALGGYCHPYHQPVASHRFYDRDFSNRNGILYEVGLTFALPTQSMLMSWDIWDRFGPFVDTPPGKIRQSEDWNFTERIRAAGLRVGSLYPPLVIPTGRTDTFGELVPEHEFIKDVPGLIVE